jgi:UDP-3-O-[3-hydroxymyristoyl] N-acetylglucosamine deacetylase
MCVSKFMLKISFRHLCFFLSTPLLRFNTNIWHHASTCMNTQTKCQRTLNAPICFSGIGIHSGKEVELAFLPAPEHHGIVFERTDTAAKTKIPAAIEYVQNTERSTTIGVGDCRVQTVEHVLAALYAYEVDNVLIQVSAPEPPVGDGSSCPFVELIERVGIQEQTASKPIVSLEYPIHYSDRNIHIVALPSNEFRISYTLYYPHSKRINCQYFSTEITPETFKKELSPCRTFALYEEITLLMKHGLIKGGSLENAVVVKEDMVISKGGLRFPNEMVRHKILDVVGDLSLVGMRFQAHIIAICSGHSSNVALGRKLIEALSMAPV